MAINEQMLKSIIEDVLNEMSGAAPACDAAPAAPAASAADSVCAAVVSLPDEDEHPVQRESAIAADSTTLNTFFISFLLNKNK